MPIGTQAPNIYPADQSPRNGWTGTPFVAVEARGGSRLLNWYASDRSDTFTITVLGVIDAKTFTASGGHSIVAGMAVELFEGDHVFQAIVTNVATNVITVDKSLPYAFTVAGTTGFNGEINGNVDGSSTEVIYKIQPPSNQTWDITTLNLFIQDATAMTSALFGGITALTEGLTLRIWHSATEYEDIANFKTNHDFFLHGGAEYGGSMAAGKYGLYWSSQFADEQGGVIRLDGSKSERLEFVVSEVLTGLETLHLLGSGYVV